MQLQPSDATAAQKQDSESLQIRAAQIELIYRQERVGMLGGLCVSLVMTIVLWNAAPRTLLIGWFCSFAFIWALRYRSVLAFLKASPKGEDVIPWGTRSAVGNLIVGLAWGAAPVLLFPHVSVIHQVVVCFLMAAIALGTATVSFPLKAVYVPRLLAGGLPLTGVLFYEGDALHLIMGSLTLVYLTVLAIVGDRMRSTFTTSLKLRFENQDLVNSLKEEKTAIERLNESLRAEIRECEQMERALRESEERFRELAELLPVIVYEADKTGKFTFVNRGGLELSGYTLEDIGNGLAVFDVVVPDDLPRALRGLAMVVNGEKLNGEQYTILKKGGGAAPVEVWSSPIMRGKMIVGGRGVGIDITERKKADEKIQTSLREKEILLREIHHRVKNNLAIISSLLRLRSRSAPEEVRRMFADALDRIKAMATAHEKLYQSENLATLDARDYMESLIEHLFESAETPGIGVTLKKEIEPLSFELDTALPLGLIVTELVANCLKHAFMENSGGQVEIFLRSVGNDAYELVVSDNGTGIPECVDLRNTGTLGINLVENFVKQLHGTIEITRENGTRVNIRFREKQRRSLPT